MGEPRIMKTLALITGGAGFIGSHLADLLLERGYRVRVLDSLDPQVHGPSGSGHRLPFQYAELVVGDIRLGETVAGPGGVEVLTTSRAVGVGNPCTRSSATPR
jgi:dTDP-L-rhamnose 4-epimerase